MSPRSRTPWLRRGGSRTLVVGLLLALCATVALPIVVAGGGVGAQSGGTSLAAGTDAEGTAGSLVSVATLPDLRIGTVQNARLPGSIGDDRGLLLGSVGSDLWRGPTDAPGELWMVTDRGPNDELKLVGESRRTFPLPYYTPHIMHVRVDGPSVDVLEAIPIVGQSGHGVTGLPNVAGHEPPYDASGQVPLAYNPSGLDVEGLVRTASGEFWVVEEYGPSLVHLDSSGTVLRRFVPDGSAIAGTDYPLVATLPSILSLRAPNRGFEGLTLSEDGRTLYLAVQGPLANPDEKTAGRSRVGRVLVFDIASERVTAEYAYPMGWVKEKAPKPKRAAKPDRAPKPTAEATSVETKVSALAPAGPDSLLVLERTGSQARLYLVALGGATNLLGSSWDDPATVPGLEATTDLAGAGVAALDKTLVADLSAMPEVPEKIEGVAILDPVTVAVANDNDFDLGEADQDGNNVGNGRTSQILTIALPRPLPLAQAAAR
jgi:hypothetical protein